MTRGTDIADFAEDLAVVNDLSLELRIPIISSPYPRWNYITAVVVSDRLWVGLMPTDDELRMVASFNEAYCSYWYGPPHTGWRARDLDLRPFDLDGGANGVTFIKHPNGGWGYRRRTWNRGPTFVPEHDDDAMPLVAVMDRCNSFGDTVLNRWSEWKADHPEVFGGAR